MKAIIVQIDRQPKIIKLFILITQEILYLTIFRIMQQTIEETVKAKSLSMILFGKRVGKGK
jgi:hypothetical protein